MENLKIVAIVVSLITFLISCHTDDNEIEPVPLQPRELVSRTVLVYMVGDAGDYNNELSALFKTNFSDMKEGMKEVDYSKYNLLVYSELVNDVPHLISLKKVGSKVVADTIFTYEEQNPLDIEVMSSVISQTVNYFPAESYGLVFLSHSDSWLPAGNNANTRSIGYYRRMEMNISDFYQAISSFSQRLKFILFDSCSMQSVEVAYELRNCAEYFIGSPTEIPGPGAPYSTLVPELFAETDLPVRIADAYYSYYEKRYNGTIPFYNWTGGVGVSVLRSDALDHLAIATKSIFLNYYQNISKIEKSDIVKYDYSINDANYDLDGLILQLTGGAENNDYLHWRKVFDEACIYWSTTEFNYSSIVDRMIPMQNSKGISCWIPNDSYNSDLNIFFRTFQWYFATGWDEVGW
ncbi:clostripain-related cysteine peptidase [Bacteroides sp.]|uniref:clostripain-related cysteine peptidase n=1 Tax=Bacteroides sp. TaxID=29523 RepID=UPI00261B2DA8|nr:clostripain-related cysteine peptidase [Bacteroides sp.]MDD3040700.1 clostripain-related cysteine peptidase [Bacteroides sp.]